MKLNKLTFPMLGEDIVVRYNAADHNDEIRVIHQVTTSCPALLVPPPQPDPKEPLSSPRIHFLNLIK